MDSLPQSPKLSEMRFLCCGPAKLLAPAHQVELGRSIYEPLMSERTKRPKKELYTLGPLTSQNTYALKNSSSGWKKS